MKKKKKKLIKDNIIIFFFRPDGLIMLNEMPSMYSGYVGKMEKIKFQTINFLIF